DPQDESPQPLDARARGGAHTGRDDEIALNRGSPVEFEGRTQRAKVVIPNHGQALHGPIVSTLLRGARGTRLTTPARWGLVARSRTDGGIFRACAEFPRMG